MSLTTDTETLPQSIPHGDGEMMTFPLSFPQQRPWFLSELHPGTAAYNIPVGLRLRGTIDTEAMGFALNEIIRRHEILRTVYRTEAGGPAQVVLPDAQVALNVTEVGDEGEALAAFHAEASKGFDLAVGPIVRVELYRINQKDHILALGLHHIACDAWSINIIARELGEIYNAKRAGRHHCLEEPTLQYVDFAEWQQDQVEEGLFDEAEAYWTDKLSDAPVQLQLFTDRPRPAIQSYDGSHINFDLPPSLVTRVSRFAADHATTPYAVYLAAYSTLLSRWSDGGSPVIGTPVASRNQAEMENMVGFFTNTLVLHPDQSGQPDFGTLVDRVGAEMRLALAHQDLPFEILVNKLSPERNPAHSPLFQVMFMLWEAGDDAIWKFDGLETEPLEGDSQSAKFDLTLSLKQSRNRMTARLEYAAALFDSETIERFGDQYVTFLENALDTADKPVCDLSALSKGEEEKLAEFSSGKPCKADKNPVHKKVAVVAETYPTAPALSDAEVSFTYNELQQKVTALSDRLQSLGVGSGSVVGVYLDRSAKAVIAMLGIMGCGAAYLPLDPGYPADRLKFMVEDAGAALVVCDAAGSVGASALGATIVPVEGSAATASKERKRKPVKTGLNDLAYLIYTSGSTGKPKGVQITHGNLSAFLTAMDQQIDFDKPGVWLAVTSISFDISVLELLWTLSRGFHVIIKDDETAVQVNGSANALSTDNTRQVDLSFHFFGNAEDAGDASPEVYDLVLDAARFADKNGFRAVWTPERHFHAFGGLYPNPAILGAAIATVTENIAIRAGSVVLPLHDPLEVAEQWALLDNLSKGRVGVSIASGWAPNDFVIAPDKYAERKSHMLQGIEELHALWRGEEVLRTNGIGKPVHTRIFPKPVQDELPFWITSARHPETFEMAGKAGGGVLTHLVGQNHEELAGKIALYRAARAEAGHSGDGHVAVMLHTFIHEDADVARETVREPLKAYIKTSFDLMKSLGAVLDTETGDLSDQEVDQLADLAFERFFDHTGLFGTPKMAADQMARMAAIGADEIGCLVDFGVGHDEVRNGFEQIAKARALYEMATRHETLDFTDAAALINAYNVTHMQCTPTTASILVDDPKTVKALTGLQQMLVGGEALPESLAKKLTDTVKGKLTNMYGPTEATVWATCQDILAGEPVSIGRPLPGYKVRIVDSANRPAPVGVPGELLIGGPAVAPGYHERVELTAERFIRLPGEKTPFYRTGDIAKFGADGTLAFLGRNDSQIKLRGRRIELGEIETVMEKLDSVRDAAVRIWGSGESSAIYGYVTLESSATRLDSAALRSQLEQHLPQHMVPVLVVVLEELPKTPNRKIDRKALPDPRQASSATQTGQGGREPETETEKVIAAVWRELLGLENVNATDNFFQIGGNSILVVRARTQLGSKLGKDIPLVDFFRHVTIEKLAEALDVGDGPPVLAAPNNQSGDKRRAARSRLGKARRSEAAA